MGPLIPFFWTSGNICPGFQSQDESFVVMLNHLHPMSSTDSPLVQHLLTSWWPVWKLLHIYKQVGLKSRMAKYEIHMHTKSKIDR